ncbi:MAG TPA: Fic family protein [Solirubrobacteraceae bacterium]|jgi:Fic family protein|nr:Fic family protein [Solirubrobacteraceae bacterium]
MNDTEQLSSEVVAALDAAYRPFPAFSDWPANPPRPDVWTAALRSLEVARASSSDNDLNRASRTAIRAAAFDTGAIEHLYETDRGLTITVATQTAAWEAIVNDRAPNALALFQAQLRAYELVLDAATQSLPVTEAWVRRLHDEVTEPQETYTVDTPVGPQEQPLPHGEYKKYPNHVKLPDGTTHSYVPVLDTSAEMERLVTELASEPFLAADPILQASYAHYALVVIHPFADGNGRVARALSSVYLYRAATIPLLIFADQKNAYLESLEAADNGKPEVFVHFVAAAARSTLALVTETLSTELSPDLDDSARALRQMITYRENLSIDQLNEIAVGLLETLERLSAERIASLDLPAGVHVNAQRLTEPGLRLTSASAPPAEVNIESGCYVDIEGNDPERTFRIRDRDNRQLPIDLALRDAFPNLSVAAELRLRGFVERWLALDVSKLQEAVASKLQL